MGWKHCHLHQFITGITGGKTNIYCEKLPINIGLPSSENDSDFVPSWEMPIKYYFLQEGASCLYTYDFGAEWNHEVTLKKIEVGADLTHVCTGGEKACPPENCGGIDRYLLFKKANFSSGRNRQEWLNNLDANRANNFESLTKPEIEDLQEWLKYCEYQNNDFDYFNHETIVFENTLTQMQNFLKEYCCLCPTFT